MLMIEYPFGMLMDELDYSILVDQLCLTNFHQVIVESEMRIAVNMKKKMK